MSKPEKVSVEIQEDLDYLGLELDALFTYIPLHIGGGPSKRGDMWEEKALSMRAIRRTQTALKHLYKDLKLGF